VTLILAMSKAEGVYLSADFRVTAYGSGHLVDNASVKMLTIHFPPPGTGARALLAYTGLAILPDGTPTGTWIKETLRGESEVPNQALAHLKDRLDRDVAQHQIGLIIDIVMIEGDRRLVGGLSNLAVDPAAPSGSRVLPRFEYRMAERSEPFVLVDGSGRVRVVADKHLQVVLGQLHVRPRKASDHMKLLATINRRVAASERTVSPACHVAFLPAVAPGPGAIDDSFGPASGTFAARGEPTPVEMPTLAWGIDLSVLMEYNRELLRASDAGLTPPDFDKEAVNRFLRRRP